MANAPNLIEQTTSDRQTPHLNIIEPPKVAEPGKYLASGGQRVVAVLLDGFFLAVLARLLYVGVMALAHEPVPVRPSTAHQIFQISVSICYWVFPLYACGQTLGKMLIGIKVVSNKTPHNLGFMQAMTRELLGKPLAGLFLGLGYLGAFTRDDHRTWYDRMCSTHVIRTRRS